jgi:hypothetical protein
MQSLGRKLAAFVARTDFIPFSLVYEFIYQLGIWYLSFRLRSIKAVRGIYLSGSAAVSDLCHGVSDIDFFVVISSEDKDNTSARTAMRAALADVIAIFPFMGPYEERRDGIVVVDEETTADLLIFSYRRKTCLFKKVYQRRGFALPAAAPVKPIEILSELNNLVTRLVKGMRDRRRDIYFWKSKLRSLFVALFNQPNPFRAIESLALSEDEKSLLQYLWRTPNYKLVAESSDEKSALAYGIFWKLIEQAIQTHNLDQLPETTIIYSLADRIPVKNHRYAVRDNALKPIDVKNFDLAGLAILDDLPVEVGSVDLHEADYHQVLLAVNESEKIEYPFNFNFHRFIVRSVGKKAGAGNIYTAPFAFPNADGDTLRIKAITLDRMIEQANAAKTELLKRYQEFLGKSLSSVPPDSADEPHLMVGEDDYQVILSLLECFRLSKLTDKSIRVYKSNREVLADLSDQYPEYRPFIEMVENYFFVLEKQNFQPFNQLPSNMFGFMVKFFLGAMKETGMPPIEELNKKLSLSLCVCTKDRPAMLVELLKSVVAQTRKPDQLVIVDNSQSNETAAVAQEFKIMLPIEYVQDAHSSLPTLRNKAIAASSGEIICFTDDDCVLDKNWLAAVERSFLRSEKIGAVGGVVRHLDTQSGTAAELFYQEYLGRAV